MRNGGDIMSEIVQAEGVMDEKDNIINVIATERDQLKAYLEDAQQKNTEKDNIISVC